MMRKTITGILLDAETQLGNETSVNNRFQKRQYSKQTSTLPLLFSSISETHGHLNCTSTTALQSALPLTFSRVTKMALKAVRKSQSKALS
jgi:hypothetical protein